MNTFIIKAVLMSIFPFYRLDFPLEHFPKNFVYTEYQLGGASGSRRLDENEKAALKRAFIENKQGWRYDVVTYVPARMFRSSEMEINCLDDGYVIVSFKENDTDTGWTQISRKSPGACAGVALTGAGTETNRRATLHKAKN